MILRPKFDAILLDVDGVLLSEREPIPGASEALHSLTSASVKVVFVSNNVNVPRVEHVARIRTLYPEGPIVLYDPIDVLLRLYYRNIALWSGRLVVVGSSALEQRLSSIGIGLSSKDTIAEASALFIGSTFDFDYDLLARAATAIRNGAILFASGRESSFIWHSQLWPGTGALVAAIEAASTSRAIVLGKPSPSIFRLAVQGFRDDARILVVGDDIIADIQGARRAGFQSALVLSGVTSPQQLAKSRIKPDYIADDLFSLLRTLD